MDKILRVENITKDYTGHRALENVSFEVSRGKIYGLLGPNGAGKTTMIRIINHITMPDAGLVTFDGHKLNSTDIYNIGYLPEERGLYKKMKVGEQALFFAQLKGMDKREARQRLGEWFERLEIAGWWDKKVEELSKGMAQKVQFIVTVLHQPKLLIFDEPFSGFDPINAGILKREILRLRNEGSTIIFSTHNMGSVEELCDDITLINNSRNILTGNVEEIRQRYSGNQWEIGFRGTPEDLENAMSEIGKVNITGANGDGKFTANLIINQRDDIRNAIATINNSVEIERFSKKIPTMDEIFVRAVSESQSNHLTSTN